MRRLLTWRGLSLLLVLLLGLVAPPASAQDSNQPIAVELDEAEDFPSGKVAAYQGMADAKGQAFALEGLWLRQPLAVVVSGQERGARLALDIAKFAGGEPVFAGSTDERGIISARFRTQGDVTIRIAAPDGPTPFMMFVWVGDEVPPLVPNATVPLEEGQP